MAYKGKRRYIQEELQKKKSNKQNELSDHECFVKIMAGINDLIPTLEKYKNINKLTFKRNS